MFEWIAVILIIQGNFIFLQDTILFVVLVKWFGWSKNNIVSNRINFHYHWDYEDVDSFLSDWFIVHELFDLVEQDAGKMLIECWFFRDTFLGSLEIWKKKQNKKMGQRIISDVNRKESHVSCTCYIIENGRMYFSTCATRWRRYQGIPSCFAVEI